MNKLLICIAFHHNPSRFEFLKKIVDYYIDTYEDLEHIYIDTNSEIEIFDHPKIKVFVHSSLQHPFHLVWMHRIHFKNHIRDYDMFMYVEDDMLVPRKSYLWYKEHIQRFWPTYIPSFLRIETYHDQEFVTDPLNKQRISPDQIIHIDNRTYLSLEYPYHAFWILPRQYLEDFVKEERFYRIGGFRMQKEVRELASSFTWWELEKKPIVEIEFDNNSHTWRVSRNCDSFHIANNYAGNPNTRHGKIIRDELLHE